MSCFSGVSYLVNRPAFDAWPCIESHQLHRIHGTYSSLDPSGEWNCVYLLISLYGRHRHRPARVRTLPNVGNPTWTRPILCCEGLIHTTRTLPSFQSRGRPCTGRTRTYRVASMRSVLLWAVFRIPNLYFDCNMCGMWFNKKNKWRLSEIHVHSLDGWPSINKIVCVQ